MKPVPKVVVAEDDPIAGMIASHVVSSLGYCPILCRDGLRALYVLEDNPDARLLIADVKMPTMDGEALVSEVRRREAFEGLPIIIVSGIARVSEIAHLLDIGVTCFLGKPVEPEDLKAHIESLVERGVIWRSEQDD